MYVLCVMLTACGVQWTMDGKEKKKGDKDIKKRKMQTGKRMPAVKKIATQVSLPSDSSNEEDGVEGVAEEQQVCTCMYNYVYNYVHVHVYATCDRMSFT